MFKRRKVIAIILVMTLLFSLTVIGHAGNEGFNDITGNWAETTIKDWREMSLISGYSDGTFRPNWQITKAEFIALVNLVFGYYIEAEDNYLDVGVDDWYSSDTAIAKENGYMDWYTKDQLYPKQPITRQEVSAILVSIMKLKTSEDLTTLENFIDYETIPEWSKPYMIAIVNGGYMKGYPDKTICAEGNITRAEAIVMLDRVIGRLIKDEGTYGPIVGTETIEGNVTVNVPNITLKNIVIKGDLILAAGIGDGDITLEDIQVEGKTIINGGGENSIKISGSKMGNIIVLRVGGKIRIVSVYSEIGRLAQESPGKLEGDFKDAEVTVLTKDLIIDGDFSDIIIEMPVELEISGDTKVNNLVVNENAEGTTVTMKVGTQVEEMTFEAGASVTGSGIIEKVNLNADGVEIQQKVGDVIVEEGVDGSGVNDSTPLSNGGGSSSKADGPAAPLAPTVDFKTNNSVTLTVIPGNEYSKDDLIWQDDVEFTGLRGNTIYTFYQRVKETSTHYASASSPVLNVMTDPTPLTGTAIINNTSPKFGEMLTATLDSGNNTGILSYQWTNGGNDISGATNDTYTVAEADIGDVLAVKISSSVEIGTTISDNTTAVVKADGPSAPSTPSEASKTDHSVTLNTMSNYEYSMDTINWQDNPIFTGLTANTMYAFYQRVKETSTHKASASSTAFNVTTNAIPISDFRYTGVSYTSESCQKAIFEWTKAEDATEIKLQKKQLDTGYWINAPAVKNDRISIIDPSDTTIKTWVDTNTTYQYRLQIVGGKNAGYSNISTFLTPYELTNNFHKTTVTSSTATFEWTSVVDAISIKIQQSLYNQDDWTDATTGNIAVNATTATVTGLASSTTYEFRLVVTNKNNSVQHSFAEKISTSNAPINDFRNTIVTDTTATFSWTQAAQGAWRISIYESHDGGSNWYPNMTPIDITATEVTVDGLMQSTNYMFKLVVDGGGNQGHSNEESITTRAESYFTMIYPATNNDKVEIDTSITIQCNNSLDTTVDNWSVVFSTGDLTLDSTNASISYGTTSKTNDTIVITPKSNLSKDTNYGNITINNFIDTFGVPVRNPFAASSYNFTTIYIPVSYTISDASEGDVNGTYERGADVFITPTYSRRAYYKDNCRISFHEAHDSIGYEWRIEKKDSNGNYLFLYTVKVDFTTMVLPTSGWIKGDGTPIDIIVVAN